MTTLLLDQPDYHLALQNGILQLTHPELRTQSVPLAKLDRLVIGHGNSLSSDLILLLVKQGVEFMIIGRHGSAHLFNPECPPNNLRLKQYRGLSLPSCREKLIWLLLAERRAGQNRVLAELGASPLPPLPSHCNDPMLVEAEQSLRYWQAWASHFASDGFLGRQRRPPHDPINALLSLSSTLEDQALLTPLLTEGFDVALGLHHATGYRRPSLLLDIKELTRADLESWILRLWRDRLLTAEHFSINERGCRLTHLGQRRFYPAWFYWQKQRQQSLRQLASRCRQALERVLRDED